MKTVTALVVLAVLIAVVALVVLTQVRRWRDRRAPWRMVEDSDGDTVSVYADRPGRERLLIGSVPFGAGDFDDRIHELRAEGRQKLLALNAGER